MKWGVRRYQNPDGTLTAAGKARYSGEAGQAKYEKDTARQNASDARKEAKTQKYKASEMKRFEAQDRAYEKRFARLSRKSKKADEAYSAKRDIYGDDNPKTAKAREKAIQKTAKELAAKSIREFERSKIANMDYTQMRKEVRAMDKSIARASLLTATGMLSAALGSPYTWVGLPNLQVAVQNARVGRNDVYKINRDSRELAEKRREEIDRVRNGE